MTDGLKDSHRRAIIAVLSANERVERAVLFGSRATGTNTVTSDVDIALFGDRLTLTDKARLAAAIDEIPMAQSVDLLLYNSIGDRTLRAHIRKHGVEWFARSNRPDVEPAISSTPSDWQQVNLGDVVRLVSGGTPSKKREDYWHGTIPWVSAKDMKQFRLRDTTHHITAEGLANGTKRVRAGTLLLLTRGMRLLKELPVCVTRKPMAFNQDVKALLPTDRVDASFLPYLVLGNKQRLLSLVDLAGHGTGRINSDELRTLDIRLPPRREQQAIAHILGTLDDKIELNRRMNETLEAMARVLFKSWFIDFDPVRAKMEGRGAGLPQDIADLFPDRLVDSEIGEIPEGWKFVPLDQIARFQNGLALQKFRPAADEARLPVVKIAQMRAGEANRKEWASAAIKPECIIDDGDVLFSWSGSLLVTIWCGGRAALNQHLFRVTSEKYPKWFYLHSLLAHLPAFRQIAQDKATTMGHIRRHHLTEALCVNPPDHVIAGISDVFSCLLDRQVATELSSRTLAVARDTLLPKLVSGELRPAPAASVVGATT